MKEQDLKEEEKQVLAEFFANQVKLSEKGQSLLDVVSFIYHYNINRVRDIFADDFTTRKLRNSKNTPFPCNVNTTATKRLG